MLLINVIKKPQYPVVSIKVNNKTRRFWSNRIYLSINEYEVQKSVRAYHAEQQDNSTYTGKFYKDLKNRCYKNVQLSC